MTTVTTTAPLTRPAITAPAPRARVRALPTLTARRLSLAVRSPRAVAVPLMAPVLFALVVAPALADALSAPAQRTTYMTFFCVATCGLLIPLNCMFFGLGVLVDREQGAMRELLVAPIRRASIVLGNLAAAAVVTALQLGVLLIVSVLRGAQYEASDRLVWFVAAAALLIATTYGIAEALVTRIPSAEEYTGVIPAIAIVPFFFAGSLYPITSLPTWLADVAKVLPLTHALALFRYGLTAHGSQALHNIWGMRDAPTMAVLSLGVLALYGAVFTAGAVRLFSKSGTS